MNSTTKLDVPRHERRAAWPARLALGANSSLRLLVIALLSVACAGIAGAIAYALAVHAEEQVLRDDAQHRLSSYSGTLASELSRFGYLPSVIALSHTVQAAARNPSDPQAVATANRFMEAANREAGSAALYLMNLRGTTVAASNWNMPDSFVGMNFAFRPYFREALAGGNGRFYGIGTTSHLPGLYFSHPLRRDGDIVGVVVAKVDLEKVALPWQSGVDPVLVVDGNGIVFLTSVPRWRFESLAPLPAATRQRLQQTRQYYTVGAVREIGLRQVGKAAGAEVVELPPGMPSSRSLFGRDDYLLTRSPVPGTNWQILSLSDMRPAQEAALRSALAGGAMAGLLEALALVVLQRRRTLRERLAAREALERAYGELEARVEARTAALTRVNQELQREVDQRMRAQSELTHTLQELAQAGKMAALGQMATGIAHELNQPLTALYTLSDNAIVFLDQERQEEARGNLETIQQLVQRMARITGELKSFARKAPTAWEPCHASQAFAGAASLIRPRLIRESIALDAQFPDDEPLVLCDDVRLQQALLNLLINAADALQDRSNKRIIVRCDVAPADAPGASDVIIRVADNGPGIPDSVLPRVFEPFFTTKAQGVGLGLGLSIVQRILRDVGASIDAGNRECGGAEFSVRIRAVARGSQS